MSNYIVIDPKAVASKLAHDKVKADLVNEDGNSAVMKESDLYKNDGTYKTWVEGIYMDEYEHFLKVLGSFHNEILLKKVFDV